MPSIAQTNSSYLQHRAYPPRLVQNIIKSIVFNVFLIALCHAGIHAAPLVNQKSSADPKPAPYVESENIKTQVTQFLEQRIDSLKHGPYQTSQYTIGHIDNRLRLAACEQPIDVTPYRPPLKAGRNVLKVSCSLPKPWKLLVPVTLNVYDRVVVSNQSLSIGTELTNQLLRFEQRPINQIRSGYFSEKSSLLGLTLKRPLIAGQILQSSMLKKPEWISKNQEVTIQNKGALVQIKTNGIALSGGSHGDRIQVKNKQSQKVISARIIGRGLVEVNP